MWPNHFAPICTIYYTTYSFLKKETEGHKPRTTTTFCLFQGRQVFLFFIFLKRCKRKITFLGGIKGEEKPCTYRRRTLNHISALILSRLQSEPFSGSLVVAKLSLQLFLVLDILTFDTNGLDWNQRSKSFFFGSHG